MASLADSGRPAAMSPAYGPSLADGASSGSAGPGQPANAAAGRPLTARSAGPRRTAAAAKTAANKATKASKAAKGNSDHRKEQNRIASRNYREKRKQKLALLQQILEDPSPSTSAPPDALPDIAIPSLLPGILPGLLAPSSSEPSAPEPATTSAAEQSQQDAATSDVPLSGPYEFPLFLQEYTGNNVTTTSPSSRAAAAAAAAAATSGLSIPWSPPFADSHFSLTQLLASPPSAPSAPSSSALVGGSVPSPMDGPPPPPPQTTTANSGQTDTASVAFASVPQQNFAPHQGYFSNLLVPTDIADQFFGPDSEPAYEESVPFPPTFSMPLPLTTSFSSPSIAAFCGPADAVPSPEARAALPSRPAAPPPLQQQSRQRRTTQSASASHEASSFFGLGPTPMSDATPTPPSPIVEAALAAGIAAGINAPDTNPSRRTRKQNKPMVRAMLHSIKTLSSHQKRLLVRALLTDDDRFEEVGEDGEGGEEGDDGRVVEEGEEEEEGDDDDKQHDGSDASDARTQESETEQRQRQLYPWRQERRRQLLARWYSEAAETATATFPWEPRARDPAASTHSAFGRAYPPPPSLTITLQCRRTGFRAAVLQNCLACGLADPSIMFDETCYEDDEDHQSPFCLSAAEARAVVRQGPAGIAQAVAGVRSRLARLGKTPPRDLQPVDAQILVAHHPYLDVIPFRGFRARALALLAEMEAAEEVAAAAAAAAPPTVTDGLRGRSNNTPSMTSASSASSASSSSSSSVPPTSPDTPCLLDEDELCYDMNVADGLVCWGAAQGGPPGGAPSAQARRDAGTTRDMRACVPWDMRSWEPQVWFLKKYWFLVGGWDDDMWRNCRWWHSMRGDELDYSVFATPGY